MRSNVASWDGHLEVVTNDCYEVATRLECDSGPVLDIGANCGIFSLWAARNGHRVVAVEPNVEMLDLLVAAAETGGLTDQITFVHAAVGCGADVGWASMSDDALIPQGLRALPDEHGTIPTLTFASIIDEYGPFEIAKIDCEGCEWPLLDEPADVLAQVGYYAIEFHASPVDHRPDHPDTAPLGKLVERLSQTHRTTTVGKHGWGGMIFATRY